MTEPDGWREKRMTEEMEEYQHFNFSKEKPEPHPYDMQKVEPLFAESTIIEKIDQRIEELEQMIEDSQHARHETGLQPTIDELQNLVEEFKQTTDEVDSHE